jgi:hypothetical protein
MNALIRRLIIDATPPIEKMSARLFKFATLFFVTVSLLFVSATFLAIGLFVFVQPFAGTAIAALVTGIIYLGAAGICIFVASRERPGEEPAAAEPGPMTKATYQPLYPKGLGLRRILTRQSRLSSTFCGNPASTANGSLLPPAPRSRNNCIRFL